MKPEEAKRIREELGLTQKELAEKLGLGEVNGRNTVGAWEKGKREVPVRHALSLKHLKSKGG